MSQFRQVEDGIFIGPQPTGQELEEARRQGIGTVIDFRLPSEPAASNETLVKSHGLAYVNIPVDKTALSANQIGDLEAAMRDEQGPFLLNCATGARAALLLSLSKARKHGWTAEQAFAESKRMGFDLTTSADFSAFVTRTVS